ncbi:hypothetical protein IAR55_006755 [Kwoniella newhampshirensis]|uniref:Serine carboxypeptidase n=1 Tax=Kwoniella newhampshirensis TaxID=1651941 RepID=A0AAW0YI25_9TREE
MLLSTLILLSASSLINAALAAKSRPTLDALTHRELLLTGRPQIGLWKALLRQREQDLESEDQSISDLLTSDISSQHAFLSKQKPQYEAHCFPQLISHFDPTIIETFCQRYWLDASSYKEGGPVFVLDGGETSGADRLPFLEKGILQILSNATNGLSIVLEHRYYGESIPVPSFSTDDLRFLNNAEALEDSAYFIANFKAPSLLVSLSSSDALHPSNTPWIYYGGSYAGARAAHMRTQYPDLVWGAIASSAVTHAQVDFPQYFDPVQRYGPEECISALRSTIKAIDVILDMPAPLPTLLKSLFGLEQLEDNTDFADVLVTPTGYWQAKNWDPAVGSTEFYNFCDTLTAGGSDGHLGLLKIPAEIVNYGKYIKERVVSRCPRSEGSPASDIEDCFGTQDDSKYRQTDLSETWRLWQFQVCTQWGYFQTATTDGPSILSKRLTLERDSKICRQAYPPGKYFSVPAIPDVEEINRRGDYAIEADRLAFIDGDRDPWRSMTPNSDLAEARKSSVNKPVHIIFDGVHHYDENGLTNHEEEPARIRDVHELEKLFVQEWVAQFKEEKARAMQV